MNHRPEKGRLSGDGRLEPDFEQMRSDGYAAIDLLVDHLSTLSDRSVGHVGSAGEMAELFSADPPDRGRPFTEVLSHAREDIFANSLLCNHPRYFAFVPGPSNFYGVLGDLLASGFNIFTGTWLESSGPAALELSMIDWLCRTVGLPPQSGGLFVSGGSVANLTGLAVARHDRLDDRTADAVIYCSDQVHASVNKALYLLGFGSHQLHRIGTDSEFRLNPDSLHRAIARDRAQGKLPFCVVANAGSTNTGAVDPLAPLADICTQEGMWFHVDGAYGASAALGRRSGELLADLGRADSLVLDPHKWMFQPFEIGAVLVRDKTLLAETFRTSADYMQDAKTTGQEINFCDHGIQLSRGFRALKLWVSLQCLGLDAIRDAIDRGIVLAEMAAREVQRDDRFEVTSPACLGIVTFRYVGNRSDGRARLDEINGAIPHEIMATGEAVVTSTVLDGRMVLRMCVINPRTSEHDIRRTVTMLADTGDHLARHADGVG